MVVRANHVKIKEKSIQSQRKNTYKGEGVGMSLICPKTQKKTSVAEGQTAQEAKGQGMRFQVGRG